MEIITYTVENWSHIKQRRIRLCFNVAFCFAQIRGGMKLNFLDVLLRLCAAALLGGLVGAERENKKRAAGFRTHILVSLGSALVMVTSEYIFNSYKGMTNLDPARLGAQVISGIGFLGAGTIIRQGASVKGLTTAASLWSVACVGLAAGIGFYSGAVMAAVIIYVTLVFLGKFERTVIFKTDGHLELCVRLENRPGKIGEVTTVIGRNGANIRNIDLNSEEENELLVKFELQMPKGYSKDAILQDIKTISGVSLIE